jgi:hypothetical protein
VTCPPRFPNTRQVHHRLDVIALGHAHGSPRFLQRDLDAEVFERADEDAHWRQASVVDHRTSPIENDGL